MLRSRKFLIPLMLAAVTPWAVTGCATIMKNGPSSVAIRSDPSEASLTIRNLRTGEEVLRGTTPHTVTLDADAGYFKAARYRVVVDKEGYDPREFDLEGKIRSGWYIGGNLVFGGLIGWLVVDPLTGAMWKLTPEEIDAGLAERTAALRQDSDGLTVVLTEDLPVPLEELAPWLEPLSSRATLPGGDRDRASGTP